MDTLQAYLFGSKKFPNKAFHLTGWERLVERFLN